MPQEKYFVNSDNNNSVYGTGTYPGGSLDAGTYVSTGLGHTKKERPYAITMIEDCQREIDIILNKLDSVLEALPEVEKSINRPESPRPQTELCYSLSSLRQRITDLSFRIKI